MAGIGWALDGAVALAVLLAARLVGSWADGVTRRAGDRARGGLA